MKEQIPQPAPLSRTLQGKTREANTASVTNVLQAYKKDISQRQEIDEDDELLQGKFETTQREELEDDELLQGKFEAAQRDELEDDELLQGKFESTQRQEAPNNTGLPDSLKSGIEQLSGLDMSDVKVHYNSSKPASVQAYAYTQGTDIHVAPGQEKHLGHEAWHVAQQKQGRVQPTTTVGGMAVNDNVDLEKEADVMGGEVLSIKKYDSQNSKGQFKLNHLVNNTVQRMVPPQAKGQFKEVAKTVYEARGGHNIPFNKDVHRRGMFSFGTNTRQAVLEANEHVSAGNRIVSVRVITGGFMNPEGVQLDHNPSWDSISNAMDTHNKSLGENWTTDAGYSLWDAKMYYNDLDILNPVPGGINAAAGAAGVQKIPMGHEGVMMYLRDAALAWGNLQSGVEALGPGISDESAERIAALIHQVTTVMWSTTDQLL